MFKDSCEKTPNVTVIRFRDSAKWLKGKKSFFTPDNICDIQLYANGMLYLLELKSTEGSNISFNPKKPYEKPLNPNTKVMIKHNQVKNLMKFAEKRSVIPGFIINFREKKLKKIEYQDETYMIHINDFIKFAKESDKSSINRDDCKKIGIPIASKKKKVNFEYDITYLINISPKIFIDIGYMDKNEIDRIAKWLHSLIK
jgi:penicillin-binding protein-related factor A (putative recombinase)